LEIKVAGSEEERNVMMPVIYIDSHREKANVESEIKQVLKEFYESDSKVAQMDPNERLKALDVVKILMGIYSERTNVKRFLNNDRLWGKLNEYDYEDLLKVTENVVKSYHLDAINGTTHTSMIS